METSVLLRELENLAAELDVDVRVEDLDETSGGLCRYGGRTCLLINSQLSPPERVALIAAELASLPTGQIFVRPQVRELLESRTAGRN